MSDESRGEGWWLASDGKWYPPESKPSALAPPPTPTASPPEGWYDDPERPGQRRYWRSRSLGCLDPDQFVYVSAQIGGDGEVVCRIKRDGRTVSTATSDGEFVIATCSD